MVRESRPRPALREGPPRVVTLRSGTAGNSADAHRTPARSGPRRRRLFRPASDASWLTPENLLQIPQRMKKVCLDRADRAAQDGRNLLVRQVVIRPQDQGRALLVGQ